MAVFFNPFFWPLTYLTLFITFTKFWEWTDDRFVDDKIGGWITSQKYTFVQIIPSSQSGATVGEMEKFLVALSSVYGNRSQKDFRTSGKFFDEFTFEIHSDGGKIAMYVRMNKSSSFPVFMTAAQTHFPKVRFLEVPNPFENWPGSWQEMNKKYQHFIGAELTFPGSDLYPTKSMSDLQRENTDNLPLKDPFLILTNSLEQIDVEDYVVLQFVCRPFDHNKVVGKKWQNTSANLKKELANNAEVARGKGGLIQPYTLQEENLINACESKMTSVNMLVKARFVFLGAKVTGKRYLPSLMGYLKLFYTDRQAIIPKEKTWEDSENATWGPFWDKLYWVPEQKKRAREMYLALIKRSGGRGGSKNFWDVRSLAAILHIPNANFGRVILSESALLQTNTVISDVDYNSKKTILIENNYPQSEPIGLASNLQIVNSSNVSTNLASKINSQTPIFNQNIDPNTQNLVILDAQASSTPNQNQNSFLKSNHSYFDQTTQTKNSTYVSSGYDNSSQNLPNSAQSSNYSNPNSNITNQNSAQNSNPNNNPNFQNNPPSNFVNPARANLQEAHLYQKYTEESNFEIPN